jgi:hypothetical protein
MRRLLVAALALVGCFAPKFQNGQLKCGAGAHPCPDGYTCAKNDTCWQNGTSPVLDLSVAHAMSDLSVGDAGSATDDMLPHGVRHQGQACTPLDTCDTGFCIDGYCCNSACGNTCQACNLPGTLGICSNVPNGQMPSGARTCNAQAASSCGRDGTCDGQGNCRDWPLGTVCMAGTCDKASNNFVAPSTCNGTGNCVANPGGPCDPFVCQDATQCYSSCTTQMQCSGSNMCVGGSCGTLPNGRSCTKTDGSQCKSGNCIDGFCCDSACGDSCQGCNVPQHQGACTTVPASTAPRASNPCKGTGTCGGYCNGQQSSCYYVPATTPCSYACVSGQSVTTYCDGAGAGQCNNAGAPVTCANHLACPSTGTGCPTGTTCATSSDCYPSSTYGCATSGANQNMCEKYCVWDSDNWDDGCLWAP